MNRNFFLVFDFTFMDPLAVLRARNAALEFLDGDLQPSDEIGVISYLTTRGLVLNEYLAADHGRVRSIIEGISAKPFKDFTRFERLVHVVDLALGDAP